MAKQLPCPNPVCTHVFSAQEVQSAELLKCPKCGQAFRFRTPGSIPPPAPTAAPAKPAPAKAAPLLGAKAPVAKAAQVVAPAAIATARPVVPMAAPVAPVAPVARPIANASSSGSMDVESVEQPVALPEPGPDPFAIPSAAAPVDDDVPLLRSRRVVKKGWTAKHYTILLLALFVVGGLSTAAVVFRGSYSSIFQRNPDDRPGQGRVFHVRNLAGKDERAFRIATPERWTPDTKLKKGLDALASWLHDDGEAWFAVAVQDFGQQRPRDSELMKAAIERLESHFGDALELANRPAKSELAGEDCQYIRFKGTFNSVTWFGECYLLAHQGFGYWFFVATSSRWGAAEDAAHVKSELEKIKALSLVTDRKGWREQPPKMETFHAQTAPLSITVPSGAWSKSPAKDVEETGELFLFGRFVREKDNRKNASILVFTTDKKSDLKESLREARSYVEKRRQEENDKNKYMVAQDGTSESGSLEQVGDRSGQQVELKLLLGDEAKRFTLLAVVHHEDKAFVINCDCAWEHRHIWQQDFRNVLATLKFTKKD